MAMQGEITARESNVVDLPKKDGAVIASGRDDTFLWRDRECTNIAAMSIIRRALLRSSRCIPSPDDALISPTENTFYRIAIVGSCTGPDECSNLLRDISR